MANSLYDKGRQKFLEGGIAILTDNIKAVMVRTDGGHYAVDLVNHEFLTDIASGDRISTSSNLGSKTSSSPAGGVFDCADILFTAVTGAQVGAVVFYKDTGVAATSPLFYYCDTITGFPFTPSGADETVVIDSGSNRVFKL